MIVFDAENLQWLSAKMGRRGTLAEISVSSDTSVRNMQLLMSLSLSFARVITRHVTLNATFRILTMKRIE